MKIVSAIQATLVAGLGVLVTTSPVMAQGFQLGVHNVDGHMTCTANISDMHGASYADGPSSITLTPSVSSGWSAVFLDAGDGALDEVAVCPDCLEPGCSGHLLSQYCHASIAVNLTNSILRGQLEADGDSIQVDYSNGCTAFSRAEAVVTSNILWNDVLFPSGSGAIEVTLNDLAFVGSPSGSPACAWGIVDITFTDEYGNNRASGVLGSAYCDPSCGAAACSYGVVPTVVVNTLGAPIYVWGQVQAAVDDRSSGQPANLTFTSGGKPLFYVLPTTQGESVTSQSGFNFTSPCPQSVAPTDAAVTVSKLGTTDEVLKFTGEAAMPSVPDPIASGVRVHMTDSSGRDVIDVTVPGGVFDRGTKVGWAHRDGAAVWTYKNHDGVSGIRKVRLKELTGGTLAWLVKGKGTALTVTANDLPIAADLQLTPTTPQSGQCAHADFALQQGCAPNSAGTGFGCS